MEKVGVGTSIPRMKRRIKLTLCKGMTTLEKLTITVSVNYYLM